MRKNYSKQQNTKPWRTPSPSHHNDLKSPRFLRSGLGRHDSNKSIKNSETNGKLNHSNSFKAKIQGIKTQANKHQNSQSQKYLNRYHGKKDVSVQVQQERNPYNSYYQYESHPDFNHNHHIKQPILTSRNISKNQKNTSFDDNQLLHISNTNPTYPKKYHQSIRKFMIQNQKLKKQNEELKKKYSEITEIKNRREKQRQIFRKNASNSQILMEKNIHKLQQQIETIKKQNDKKEEQFQCLVKKYRKVKEDLNEANIKIKQYNESDKRSRNCQKCEQFEKILGQNVQKLQIVMLQSSRKQAIINSLCSEIKNLQNEIKNLQKPKNYIKKINNLIAETNDEIVTFRIAQLNRKYQQKSVQKKQFVSPPKFMAPNDKKYQKNNKFITK